MWTAREGLVTGQPGVWWTASVHRMWLVICQVGVCRNSCRIVKYWNRYLSSWLLSCTEERHLKLCLRPSRQTLEWLDKDKRIDNDSPEALQNKTKNRQNKVTKMQPTTYCWKLFVIVYFNSLSRRTDRVRSASIARFRVQVRLCSLDS